VLLAAVFMLVEISARVELNSPAVWILLIAASVAHAFPVIAPRHQAYHATQAFLMASVLLLSWPAIALIILVTHLAEWLRRRRPWYIQLYNAAVYLLSAGAALATLVLLDGLPFGFGDPRRIGSAIASAIVLPLMNHALTVVVLRLARGVSVVDSGLVGRESLVSTERCCWSASAWPEPGQRSR